MALVPLRILLDHAAENNYGMAAFNVNNMEQVHAIMQAADEVDSPVIMQGSAGARSYAGEPFLRHLIIAAIEQYRAGYGLAEYARHRRNLRGIPIRVQVNGTRGKSSVTRLIAAGLRAGGYLKNADKGRARVVHPNGLSLPNKGSSQVIAGSTIIVPLKPPTASGTRSFE